MVNSYKTFRKLIDDTMIDKSLYEYLCKVVNPPMNLSDLLRTQWVQSVSAFDKLVHDLIRVGMVEIFIGERQTTPKYDAFTLNIKTSEYIRKNPSDAISMFDAYVRKVLSQYSYQDPKNVADGLSYIWNCKDKWKVISSQMGMDKTYCTTHLKNITIRRNQIVHEGDYQDITADRQMVFSSDVDDVRDFISSLGCTIFTLVNH